MIIWRQRAARFGTGLRVFARWLVLHALVRVATRRWAAGGDVQAALISDPAARHDPVPYFERLRASGPITRTKIGHVTTSHQICQSVLRSDDFRTTSLESNVPAPVRWVERGTRGRALHPLLPPSLLSIEPPDHTRYRTLVSSVFTARAVAGLTDQVQDAADRLLDDLEPAARSGQRVDLIERYCAQLPVVVISEILGVPPADRDQVLHFGELAAPSLDVGLPLTEFRDVERGLSGFDTWLRGHIAALRRNPGSDLMSKLCQARLDGRGLNDQELRATAGLVLVAGFETTVNLLGNGVRLLLDNPDELAVLGAAPDRWPNAVEEVLRLESPVQLTARTALRDTTIDEHPVAAGEMVSLLLAAANRDPALFVDPHRFSVTRDNAARHLSFSAGRHFCVGAALARVEGEVGLRSLFQRYPELRPAGPGERRSTRVLRGWATLPVELGQPAGASLPG